MLLPIRTDSPLRNNPWANWILIALNIVCFIVQLLAGDRAHGFELNPQAPQLWQFVTYAFMHQNMMHIGGNMLFLYIFGNNVNDKMGNAGYLAFYLAGAIFAGVGHVLQSEAYVIGASGAVSAVTGAYLILFPRANVTVVFFFIIIGAREIPSLWFILFSFVMDVYYISTGISGGVAYMAHIAGNLFGVFVCLGMLMINMLPRDQYDVLAILKHRKRRWDYQNLVRGGYDPFDYRKQVNKKQTPEEKAKLDLVQDIRSDISSALQVQNLTQASNLYLRLIQVDPNQVLSRQAQLDVANHLASEQRYAEAVNAYESFLRQYPNFEQIEQVQLMAGIISSRYLNQPARGKEHLLRAMARLHTQREIDMAKTELERIGLAGA